MWNLCWVIPASLATLVIWAVSAIANYEYGLTQGTADPVHILWFTVTTSQMNGYASLAVDVLKVSLPAAAVVAWVLSKRLASVSIAGMFILCLAWSTQNSMGYVLSNHSRAVDGRGQTADQWAALRSALEETQAAQKMVPEHRPASVVKAELQGLKSDRKFIDSGACSSPAAARAVNFCEKYRGLLSEEAAAESGAALVAKLADLRGQLDRRKRVSDGDPLGTAAAAALGIHQSTVTTGRSVSFSLLVEVISAVGMALIFGTFAAAMRRKSALVEARPAETVTLSLVPEAAPEPVSAVPDAPEPVQEVSKPRAPRTPPGGGGKGKPEPVVTTYHDVETDEPNVIRFAERPADTRAQLPSFASDIFEEAAPPAKHARRAERKHKAMGSSKEWLAECTERADGVVCPAEDAWAAYRAWCDAEGMKQLPRSKFHNTISARIGNVSAGGKRGYVGLVLLDLVEEKKRAVA